LTCSRKRKVQKISPRHQSERLVPCGDYSSNTKKRFLEVFNFRHFYRHYTFDPVGDLARNKQIKDHVMVSVVFRVDTVDTSAN
jgi:hypothetical protein